MKLALGTVQFGLNYGISNSQGQVGPNQAKDIITFAANQNISTLDTAVVYGNSEQVLGDICQNQHRNFNIITKVTYHNNKNNLEHKNDFVQQINSSLVKLKRNNEALF